MKAFLLLTAGGLILTVGDIIQKQWAVSGKIWMFWLGIAVWTVGFVFLAWSFKYKNMAIASVIFVLVNIISLLLVSWFYYGEKITPVQLIGLGLAIIAVMLLE